MIRLEAIRVSAGYGKKEILRGIDLPPLKDGEVLGLVGANASGKTTLLRCLSGEHRFEGEVRVDGRSRRQIGHESWHREVAFVPQSPPQPTALQPVELLWSSGRALSLFASDRELAARVEDCLALLGLTEFAFSPLSTLSGGKRQLVGIALALLRDPALFLLDEPTSALDLHWRLVVLDLVRQRVRDRGGAVVAALHDLDLAARYCDKIALIGNGRLISAGEPAAVLTRANLAQAFQVETAVSVGSDGRVRVEIVAPISPSPRPSV